MVHYTLKRCRRLEEQSVVKLGCPITASATVWFHLKCKTRQLPKSTTQKPPAQSWCIPHGLIKLEAFGGDTSALLLKAFPMTYKVLLKNPSLSKTRI